MPTPHKKYYTGIGSRITPEYIGVGMISIAKDMAKKGYILRSGGAPGADTYFETGCDLVGGNKDIYLPWNGFNGLESPSHHILDNLPNIEEARQLVKDVHRSWNRLTDGGKKLHTRNVYQVLGKDLHSPSSSVYYWSPSNTRGEISGGTRTAVKLAQSWNLPCYNLYDFNVLDSYPLGTFYYLNNVYPLREEEVFVFGSNLDGYHGAGGAGFASWGYGPKPDYSKWPDGKKGLWNVKGCVEGFQEGTEGKSYAIPTIVSPGKHKSMPLDDIKKSVDRFYSYARMHPQYRFIISWKDDKLMNGYLPEQFFSVWTKTATDAIFDEEIPKNVIFHKSVLKYIL